MHYSARVLAFGIALSVRLSVTVEARAEPEFPGAILEAADMRCVPTCLLCHTTNPGNASSWATKPFGVLMFQNGIKKGDPSSVKTAWSKVAADTAKAELVANVRAGRDPDPPHADICGPTYGCGAHLAKPAPQAGSAVPYWVAGALLLGSLLRRRKQQRF